MTTSPAFERTAARPPDPARPGPFGFPDDPRARLFLMALLVLVPAGLTYHARLWLCVDPAGLSCVSHKTPYWDFLNLWRGGRLALDGQVSVLFEPETWRALLRAQFSPALPDSEWSYPPTMLLFGAPLSLLPLPAAYWLFTLAGIAALYAALSNLTQIPAWIRALSCLSPLMLQNALFGQNGAFTAALLTGALALAPKRPLIAGLLAGLLTVKPHLGVLIPVAWIAAGYFRAAFSAAATAGLMVLISLLALGPQVWNGFFDVTTPMMVAILEADFPQTYHTQAFTVFVAARALGASLDVAYAAQIAAALSAIAVTFMIWRPSSRLGSTDRVIVTALLALLATPYAYSYDAVIVPLAMIWFAWKFRPRRAVLAALWLLLAALCFIQLFNGLGYPFFVAVPAALSAWALAYARRGQKETAGS